MEQPMSNAATIEALGFTKDEIAQRVVDTIVRDLTQQSHEDEDGERWFGESEFKRGIDKAVRERIDAEVTRVADEHIAPRIAELIDGCTLQQTNQWGEKRGEPVTFTEYLVQRAEEYMVEPVSYDGKTREQNGGYSFTAKGTRVAYMIDKHLNFAIETAMKQALGEANASIAKGLNEAVRTAISNLQVQMKTEVKTR
jgi:hypothetical protein